MLAFVAEAVKDGLKCKIKGLKDGDKPSKLLIAYVLKEAIKKASEGSK